MHVIGNNTTKSTPFVTTDGWVWFQGTDNKLWKVFNDGTQQSQPGNNTTSSSPIVIGQLVYFQGTDNKLWQMHTDGTQQVNLGGNTTSSTPAATADSVYFQGTDNRFGDSSWVRRTRPSRPLISHPMEVLVAGCRSIVRW
jgi:hypothetical protein